jgi:hypothetical protein
MTQTIHLSAYRQTGFEGHFCELWMITYSSFPVPHLCINLPGLMFVGNSFILSRRPYPA